MNLSLKSAHESEVVCLVPYIYCRTAAHDAA